MYIPHIRILTKLACGVLSHFSHPIRNLHTSLQHTTHSFATDSPNIFLYYLVCMPMSVFGRPRFSRGRTSYRGHLMRYHLICFLLDKKVVQGLIARVLYLPE